MAGDPVADNLGHHLRRPAAERPDAVAVIDLFGGRERRFTYGDLDRRMDRVAAMLAGFGLAPGDRLALGVGNRIEFIEVFFGAMRAGVVPAPLNVRLGADTLRYVLADSGARAAVVEPACNAALPGIVEEAGLEPRLAVDGASRPGWRDYAAGRDAAPDRFDPPALVPDHPCFLPYTSGSTGRPKGVVLTHAGQLWWLRCATRYWPATPEQRALVAVPLYHKNAMAGAVKPRLFTGGSFVLMPGFEPRAFLRALAGYRCTNVGGVPTVFSLLLQERDLLRELDFSALRSIVVGPAPVHRELMQALKRVFGGVQVSESYGLTEGGPVMIGPPLDGRPVPFGSCGVAWPEGEVKLVGPDGGREGDYGELWVRNPGVSPGYYNRPEVNAERYVDGWLRTGDLFARDADGFYYFRGRTDDMFNCGGENVYPIEVENLLLAHPDVVEACVVPVPHATKGRAPVAMVALRPGSTADEGALRRFCLERGPAYAHPRRVVIVEALPLSGAAKIDRSAIARRMAVEIGTVGTA